MPNTTDGPKEANEELIERLEQLKSVGRQVKGTSDAIDVRQRPPYFDEERFQRAQATCQKYFANLGLSSITGLLLLLQVNSILIPLLKTGKSRTICDLYERYAATIKFTRKCYESNIYEPTSEGWKYLSIVRRMHINIHNVMKDDPTVVQAPPNVWMNQYDMALTQHAFIGLFLMQPDRCGAYHVTREELADVVYYWRLISYYLCIEERFNLFVYHDNIDKQLEYTKLIVDHMNEELKGPRNETGTRMAEGVMLAFEDLSKETTFNILDHWWSPYVSLSGLENPRPYTFTERLKSLVFILYFKVLFRSSTIMAFSNTQYKKKVDKFIDSGDEIKRKLGKKYKGITYEQ